ncbi:hypothetical protein JCM10207_001230 [Rhodosporidiobolus poonsookiae]
MGKKRSSGHKNQIKSSKNVYNGYRGMALNPQSTPKQRAHAHEQMARMEGGNINGQTSYSTSVSPYSQPYSAPAQQPAWSPVQSTYSYSSSSSGGAAFQAQHQVQRTTNYQIQQPHRQIIQAQRTETAEYRDHWRAW